MGICQEISNPFKCSHNVLTENPHTLPVITNVVGNSFVEGIKLSSSKPSEKEIEGNPVILNDWLRIQKRKVELERIKILQRGF
jgi:hypothetical protein